MQDNKPWWQSKTMWGAVVALLAGLASLAGVRLDATVQQEVADILSGAANIVAASLACYGRMTATATLTWRQG